MSNHYSKRVSDEEVVDAVRDALDDGERDDGNGGVPAHTVADRLNVAQSTATDRLGQLVDDGVLAIVDGWPPGELRMPRQSYLPAYHDDAPQDGDPWLSGERRTPSDVLSGTRGLVVRDERVARELLHGWDGWQYGVSPASAAAAAYYVARLSNPECVPSQARVAGVFDVSEVSVRNHYESVVDANGGWSEVNEL